MKRGEIYMVSLDPTMGHEQRGYRPVLIVSPTSFNEATKLPVILPITSGGAFARRIMFAVPLAGTKTTGVVRCDQPRVLDIRAFLSKVYSVDGETPRTCYGATIFGRFAAEAA